MIKPFVSSIYWVYLGLILGVSFLATPVKFKVTSLSKTVALQIGRETFHSFNKVEWFFVMALVASSFMIGHLWLYVLNGVLLVLLCMHTFILLPKLDARIEGLVQGQPLKKGKLHKVYVVVELMKLCIVCLGGLFIQGRLI